MRPLLFGGTRLRAILLASGADARKNQIVTVNGKSVSVFHPMSQILHVVHFDIENTSAPGTFGVIMPMKAMIETVGSIRHFQLLNLPVFRKLIEIAVDRALADVGVLLNDGIVYLFSGGM